MYSEDALPTLPSKYTGQRQATSTQKMHLPTLSPPPQIVMNPNIPTTNPTIATVSTPAPALSAVVAGTIFA